MGTGYCCCADQNNVTRPHTINCNQIYNQNCKQNTKNQHQQIFNYQSHYPQNKLWSNHNHNQDYLMNDDIVQNYRHPDYIDYKQYQNKPRIKNGNVMKKQEQEKYSLQNFDEIMQFDGVNTSDYYTYSGLFTQCPICSLRFTENQRPNLRYCGHFVCSNQFCIKLSCAVPNCKQKSQIKIQSYWPWVSFRVIK